MDDLICPACLQAAHRPWGGKMLTSMFLDGDDGFYSNQQTFELICPVTKNIVYGSKVSTGSKHSQNVTNYNLYLPDKEAS